MDKTAIKKILLAEATDRVNTSAVKEMLHKEASQRMDEVKTQDEVKKELLREAIMNLEFIEKEAMDKEGMAFYTGSSWYNAAKNLEVREFPSEEHDKIQAIRNRINEDFAPMLVQKIKTQGAKKKKCIQIDLQKELGAEPFYIRLEFKKHLLPNENKDDILDELNKLSPAMNDLVEQLETTDVMPLPYYNRKCDKGGPTPGIYREQALNMVSDLTGRMAQGGQFISQNPQLKKYWDTMGYQMQGENWPPFYRNLAAVSYSSAVRVPKERAADVKDPRSYMWAIHWVETQDHKTMYRASPEEAANVRQEWEHFVKAQLEKEEQARYENNEIPPKMR